MLTRWMGRIHATTDHMNKVIHPKKQQNIVSKTNASIGVHELGAAPAKFSNQLSTNCKFKLKQLRQL